MGNKALMGNMVYPQTQFSVIGPALLGIKPITLIEVLNNIRRWNFHYSIW
jgi:hypothetical protein